MRSNRTAPGNKKETPERPAEPIWARDLFTEIVSSRAEHRRAVQDQTGGPVDTPQQAVHLEWQALQREAEQHNRPHQPDNERP